MVNDHLPEIDYYGLKTDLYGAWKDAEVLREQGDIRYTKAVVRNYEWAYRCLEDVTSVWASSFDRELKKELDELEYQHPRIGKQVREIIKEYQSYCLDPEEI